MLMSNQSRYQGIKIYYIPIYFFTSFNSSAFFIDDIDPGIVPSNEESGLSKATVEYYQTENVTNQVPHFKEVFDSMLIFTAPMIHNTKILVLNECRWCSYLY